MIHISKSNYIKGLKCPKALYLNLFHSELRDETSDLQQHVFDIGHNVGRLAQQLFPDGIDASRGEPANYTDNITYTRQLIENGQKVIYEAAFGDAETLCYLDILVNKNGEWYAYEVKASTAVKEYHLNDAAYQYFVITRSGLPLKEVAIVHINNKYVRHREIDIAGLFSIENITKTVIKRQKGIPDKLKEFQQILSSGTIPEVPVGNHCSRPFPCDFISFCWKDIPEEEPDPNEKSLRNQAELDSFKDQLIYPLYFMDFETFQAAVPIYDETRPYQQIPFQYSLHLQNAANGRVEHREYLATPPDDPREEFILSLLRDVGTTGTILVYNKTFENRILRELACDLPGYQEQIDILCDRLVDLMIPFRRKYLYSPQMKGKYSLKAVIPALVPDLSYDNLEIREGGTASATYEQLFTETDNEVISQKRRDLLDYCKRDTESMVRLLAEL